MSGRDDRGAEPERPMLILGDDVPDVEDTTPEQLRREQEEARREIELQRREAKAEIERRRREAEREIAELEAQKERELKQRERELERTQRKLYKREKQLLRKAGTSGTPRKSERLVTPVPRPPLRERGLRRSGVPVTLGLAAAISLGVAGATAGGGADPQVVSELEALDQAHVLHMRSGLAADEVIAARMAGRSLPSAGEGSIPGQALVDEAVALAPESERYGERTVERIEQVADEETGTIRALTLWSQAHDEAGYAVGSWEVDDLREEVTDGEAIPLLATVLGLLALLVLVGMAVVAQAWLALPVLVLATALGVAVVPPAAVGVNNGVADAADAHDAAVDAASDVYDQVGRDLQAAYGISTSSYAARSEYWTDDPFYDVPSSAALSAYLEAREAVGEAEGDEATYAAAVDLAQAGREAFEERVPAVEDARARLVNGAQESGSRGWTVLLGFGAAVLAAVGVALSGGRRESE